MVVVTQALPENGNSKRRIAGFENRRFALNPMSRNRIKPGAFLGNSPPNEANILVLFGGLVMSAKPPSHPLALVPTSVIPDDNPYRFARLASDVY